MAISCFCAGVSGALIHESLSDPFDVEGLDESQDEGGFIMCSDEAAIGCLGEMGDRLDELLLFLCLGPLNSRFLLEVF